MLAYMALEIIVAILLVLCLVMACIPTLPGIPLMFVTTLVYGLVDGFQTMPAWWLAVFGGITVLSMLVDTFSGMLGAKLGGASRRSLLAGMAGLFIGLLFFPPLGPFIGLFLGVLIAEIVQAKDHAKAIKAAASSLAAAIVGTLTNITLALAYVVTFLIVVF